MKPTQKEYEKMTKKASPPSPIWKNCLAAFIVGGAICAGGEALINLYMNCGLDIETARTAESVTLVAFSAILTMLSLYEKIARFAGAGTLVPITGFANAMVSPAVEFKTEGHIAGIGAKMFTIAGPVLVFGISSSAVYGLILYTLISLGVTL